MGVSITPGSSALTRIAGARSTAALEPDSRRQGAADSFAALVASG